MADSLVYTILGIDKASPAFESAGKSAKNLADKLDGFGKVGLASMAAVTAASAASGVAIAASLAGATLAFVGLGIAAQAGNEKVVNSFSALGDQVQHEVMAMTEPLVPQLTAVADAAAAVFGRLEPLIARGVGASSAHIDSLTEAVTGFAENAMPGMVRSVERAGPVMEGLAEFAAHVGTGLSLFFDEISEGADGAGEVLSALGGLIRDLLSRIGSLATELTNAFAGGRLAAVFDSVMGVVDAVISLASGALPVLGGAVMMAADAIDGLLIVIGPLADELGGMIGVALALAAAWKVLGAATSAISGAVTAVGNFKDKATTAAKAGQGLSLAAGGVAGILGGPLGIALGAVSVGLGLLGAAQESSAAETRAHTAYVEAMTDALRDSGGALDENARKIAAGTEEVKAAVEVGKKFGIGSDEIISAAMGQGDAIDTLRTRLEGLVETNKVYATTEVGGESAWTGMYNSQGNAAIDLLGKLNSLNGGTREAKAAAQDFGAAMRLGHRSLLDTSSAGVELNTVVGTLGSKLNDLDTRARAAADALNTLFGADLSLEESQARVNAQLLRIKDMFTEAEVGAKGFASRLLDASGAVNTTTKEGQALFGVMKDLRTEVAQTAQKTFDLAVDSGATLPEALATAERSVQSLAKNFVDNRRELGLNEKQAAALLRQFDIFPDAVSIALLTPHMSETQRELLLLQTRLDKAAVGARIPVESLSDEAQRKLENLGFTVKRLPNGKVEVQAHTQQALNDLKQVTRTETKNVIVRVQQIRETNARQAGSTGSWDRALGGPVEAGRPYWVGEHGPELVFPSRSGWVATTAESERIASAMADGLTIGPNGRLVGTTMPGSSFAPVRAAGGMSVVVNVNGAQEPTAVAEEIYRKLLTLKRDRGGASLNL